MKISELEVAWTAHDGDGHGTVVWADNEPQALTVAGNCPDIDGVDEIHRSPEFDQYRPGPVPMKVLLEHGWCYQCWSCDHQITSDGCDDCIKPRSDQCYVPVCTKTMVFCSRHCHKEYVEDQRREVKEKAQAIRAIRRLMRKNFPGAKIVKVSTTYEKVGDRRFSGIAEFKFPGAKGTARYSEARPKECNVQPRDFDAWGKWRGKPAKIVRGDPVDSYTQDIQTSEAKMIFQEVKP